MSRIIRLGSGLVIPASEWRIRAGDREQAGTSSGARAFRDSHDTVPCGLTLDLGVLGSNAYERESFCGVIP